MVTVIHYKAHSGNEAVECHCSDAKFSELAAIVCRQSVNTAHIIVYDAYINTLGSLALQYFQHTVPHYPGTDYKILEEDEFFRLFKLCQKILVQFLADSVVGHLRILSRRISCRALEILKQPYRRSVLIGKLIGNAFIPAEVVCRFFKLGV